MRGQCWPCLGLQPRGAASAKCMASAGHVSDFSRQELLQGMRVKPRNKDPKYIDAQEWLEVYADRHAEQSPITEAVMLPSRRNMLYWLQHEPADCGRQVHDHVHQLWCVRLSAERGCKVPALGDKGGRDAEAKAGSTL